jgi:flap endonuclease-1
MTSLIKKNKNVINNDGQEVYHIYAILEIIYKFSKNKMKPLFIFDGEPSELKTDKVKERKVEKKESNDTLKIINEAIIEGKEKELTEEQKEYIKSKTKMKELKIRSLKFGCKEQKEVLEILDLYKIPYIKCVGEADITCGYLSKHGIVDYILTNDSDILCFGAKKIILSFFLRGQIVEIDIERIKKKFNIDQDIFLESCLMMGTDYNKSTGMTFEAIIRLLRKNIPHLFVKDFDYRRVKDYYHSDPKNKEEMIKRYTWEIEDKKSINNEICEKFRITMINEI